MTTYLSQTTNLQSMIYWEKISKDDFISCCCEHLEKNLIYDCTYKMKKLKDLVDLVMHQMAGADTLEEFDALVPNVPLDAF